MYLLLFIVYYDVMVVSISLYIPAYAAYRIPAYVMWIGDRRSQYPGPGGANVEAKVVIKITELSTRFNL